MWGKYIPGSILMNTASDLIWKTVNLAAQYKRKCFEIYVEHFGSQVEILHINHLLSCVGCVFLSNLHHVWCDHLSSLFFPLFPNYWRHNLVHPICVTPDIATCPSCLVIYIRLRQCLNRGWLGYIRSLCSYRPLADCAAIKSKSYLVFVVTKWQQNGTKSEWFEANMFTFSRSF